MTLRHRHLPALALFKSAKREEIIVKDSVNSTSKLIDMTIPSDRNIALKEIEKKSKYKDLELEIQGMWQMKTEVIPEVVGALGTVKKGMVENIKKVLVLSSFRCSSRFII